MWHLACVPLRVEQSHWPSVHRRLWQLWNLSRNFALLLRILGHQTTSRTTFFSSHWGLKKYTVCKQDYYTCTHCPFYLGSCSVPSVSLSYKGTAHCTIISGTCATGQHVQLYKSTRETLLWVVCESKTAYFSWHWYPVHCTSLTSCTIYF